MQISEIRIKLMESSEDRLRAFCSITIDGAFVVRDLKIIDGSNGPFVAMPSRKLTAHCQRCSHKNHLRATYCNHCGVRLQIDADIDSPQKLYADVAHPINSECREQIQAAVIAEFEAELARSREPGYQSRYDDDFDYDADELSASEETSKSDEPSGTAIIDQEEVGSDGSGSPRRPHFMDTSARERVNAEERGTADSQTESVDDDDFGAGIF
ncbi:putative septation protein SpoVG [Planctomycetes bacterium CA13]|uniref:Putative septation protein SpoVG n=1 Tax=Novipirellula herctigrandis TaxID=2527986 RepID=A0A5C5YP94_9BACT|nr:putative septation protein SpoVG [Planctomycetes bacterium CA13]